MFSLIRARIDNQIRNPENATTPNARLNLCRKAAGFILRMFQLHDHRPREVVFPLRFVRLEFAEAREGRPIPRLNDRASLPSLRSGRSAPIQLTKNPAPHISPMRTNPTIPHFSFFTPHS